ncbi:hypothetical protein K445DRAFT_27821 [Daldinia sp. EC12]|nr:hypothetical protein F4774DRAFT_400866 [Daldinia eschscholtzii]OTB10235.1 hypothetical protein K445DRAFT_27821 [Daldinia sp. EC12]
MQFSTITILALAAVATAAPAEVVEARTTTPDKGCTNEQPNQVCCSGLLGCVLSGILGSSCGGQAYCCNNNVKNGDGNIIPINVNALNCVNVVL